MTNKRDLKAYVRYDGSGRVIAGSLVLRRNKPKVGNWQEVQGYECCNAPTLNSGTINTESFPWTPASFVVYCDSSNQYIFVNTSIDVNSLTELVAALNSQGSNVGKFSIAPDGESINLTLSVETAMVFKDCINDLVFETFED